MEGGSDSSVQESRLLLGRRVGLWCRCGEAHRNMPGAVRNLRESEDGEKARNSYTRS